MISTLSAHLGTNLNGSVVWGLCARKNAKIETHTYAIENTVFESAFV